MEDILLEQKNTEAKLMFIDNTIGELKALADDVYDNSSKSQSAASSTLQKAEELLDEASKPLAFVNVNETKGIVKNVFVIYHSDITHVLTSCRGYVSIVLL